MGAMNGQQDPPPLDADRRASIVARMESVPLAQTLGLKLERLETGVCHLSLGRRKDLDGIFASLHGGILATLADSAIAFAALTLTDPDETLTTVEFNIRFLSPCREEVLARAAVLKCGRTLVTGEVDLVGKSSGTRFAVCGLTYMRLGARIR